MLQITGSWLHISAALQPSSGQLIQIKYLQCAYSMGSQSVYKLRMSDKSQCWKKVYRRLKICITLI